MPLLPPAKDQLFQTDHCTTPLQNSHRTGVDQQSTTIGKVRDDEEPQGSGNPVAQQPTTIGKVRDDEEPQGSGNPVAQQATTIGKVRDDEEPQGSGNPVAQQSTTIGKVRDDEEPQGSGNPVAQQSTTIGKVRDDEEPQGSGNPVAQQSTTIGKVRDDEEPQGSGNPVAQQSTTIGKVRDDEEPQGSGNPVAQQSTTIGKVRDDEEPQGSGNPVAQQSTTIGKVRDDEEPQGSGNPVAQQSTTIGKVRDDEEPQGSGNPVAQQSTTIGKVRDDEEPQGSGNPVAQQSSVNKVRDDEEPQGSGNPVAQQSSSNKVRDEEPRGSGHPEAWKHALSGITSPLRTSSSPLLNLPQDHTNICAALRGRGVTVSVLLKVKGFALRAIIDSGAETTILNKSVAEKIGLDYKKNPAIPIRGAFQTQLTNAYLTRTDICIGTGKYNWDLLVAESNDDMLLGADFLYSKRAQVDFEEEVFHIGTDAVPIIFTVKVPDTSARSLKLDHNLTIPSRSGIVTICKTNVSSNEECIVEPMGEPHADLTLLTTVVKGSTTTPVCILNWTDSEMKLLSGTEVGKITPIVEVISEDSSTGLELAARSATPNVSSDPVTLPDHLKSLHDLSSKNMNSEQSQKLAILLDNYSDVFCESDFDLGSFTAIKHHIDTRNESPVRQRMRRTPLGFEKEEEEHLRKMLQYGVIQPSVSEWASAPVLIRKKRSFGQILHRLPQFKC